MSDNDVQSIEEELSQRNSNLTEGEIEDFSATVTKPTKKRKFPQLLNAEYPHRSHQEMSLAGMVMWRTGDAELAARIVACSDTTEKEDWSEAEIEEKRRKITQWDALNQWGRGSQTDDDDNDPNPGNDTSSNQEYTPQRRRSNRVSNPSQLDPDAERKRSMRKDLVGK